MANEHDDEISPAGGFKVKIKDSTGTTKYLEADATWGEDGVKLDDEWFYTEARPRCGMCPGCEVGDDCLFPTFVTWHLSVNGNDVVFSDSAASWSLSDKKLRYGTTYLEVSGDGLVLGSSGHEVTTER